MLVTAIALAESQDIPSNVVIVLGMMLLFFFGVLCLMAWLVTRN